MTYLSWIVIYLFFILKWFHFFTAGPILALKIGRFKLCSVLLT